MKRKVAVILAALLLSLGVAFAQDDETIVITVDDQPTESMWAGISAGYPSVGLHFGLSNAIGSDIDVRGDLGLTYFGGFSFGTNVLFGLPLEVDPDVPLEFYAGGGPKLYFVGAVAFGLDLVVGGEYRLSELDFDSGGVFLELGPSLLFTPAFGGGFVSRLGFNYHF